jgi:hypothetical protein
MAQDGFSRSSRARRHQEAELFFRDLMGGGAPPRRRPSFDGEEQPDPPTPTGLKTAQHWHVERSCSGTTWTTASSATRMSPSKMDPGFYLAKGAFNFDRALDNRLIALMVDDAENKKHLAPESITKRWPSEGDKIRVALVDLTGATKLCTPGYAGWGSTYTMKGSSTAKIGVIHAAHQIVFDLNEMAKAGRFTTKAQLETHANGTVWSTFVCKPKIGDLVDINQSVSPVRATMKSTIVTALNEIVTGSAGNEAVSNTLLKLGFEYVASVLWQSGLRHPTRAGLWFHNTYAVATEAALFNAACHAGTKPVVWKDDPMRETGIVLTACSIAHYFTLLAQRRLVDTATSAAIETLLSGGCTIHGALKDAVPSRAVKAAKCGTASGFVHDAALVEHGKFRYVVVLLTRGVPWHTTAAGIENRKRFFRAIDALIVANNP